MRRTSLNNIYQTWLINLSQSCIEYRSTTILFVLKLQFRSNFRSISRQFPTSGKRIASIRNCCFRPSTIRSLKAKYSLCRRHNAKRKKTSLINKCQAKVKKLYAYVCLLCETIASYAEGVMIKNNNSPSAMEFSACCDLYILCIFFDITVSLLDTFRQQLRLG